MTKLAAAKVASGFSGPTCKAHSATKSPSSPKQSASEEYSNTTISMGGCSPRNNAQGDKNDIEWYHKNYLDHVYAVSDDNGNIDEHYRYSAFGEVEIYSPTGTKLATSAIDNEVLWNSRRFDFDTNLYYYKYRHYKADYGRWLGRDPIEEDGGINLYGFVENEPIGRWDKFGHKLIYEKANEKALKAMIKKLKACKKCTSIQKIIKDLENSKIEHLVVKGDSDGVDIAAPDKSYKPTKKKGDPGFFGPRGYGEREWFHEEYGHVDCPKLRELALEKKIKMGSVIYLSLKSVKFDFYNSNYERVGGVTGSAESIAAHELKHAWDYDQGKVLGYKDGMDLAEVTAVRVGNEWRRNHKEKIRTHYGFWKIPQPNGDPFEWQK